MKILLAHCYYQLRGGEDGVFEQEKKMLEESAEVHTFTTTNQSGIKGLIDFLLSFHHIFVYQKFKKVLKELQPDVVHIHNWHYATGPIIIRAAKKMNVPVVMTLHNFRLLCPSATLLHDGNIFTNSIHASFPWKAIFNRVYRNSIVQTFWLAFIVWYNKKIGTWKMVDTYIVLTESAKELFVQSSFGVSTEKFMVKPNFVSSPFKNASLDREDKFLFVGRLSEEKGVLLLLETFSRTGFQLIIAGDGPLKDKVLKASKENPNIEYVGNKDKASILSLMEKCTALIFPSIWFEGMPLTIIEALSCGTPIIASNIGAMKSMIEEGVNGLHFEPNDSDSLQKKLEYWLTLESSEKDNYCINSYNSYLNRYTPQGNEEQLSSIYQSVIHSGAKKH